MSILPRFTEETLLIHVAGSHTVPKLTAINTKLNKISCQLTQNIVCIDIILVSAVDLLTRKTRPKVVLRLCVSVLVQIIIKSHSIVNLFWTSVYAVGLTEEDMDKPQVSYWIHIPAVRYLKHT